MKEFNLKYKSWHLWLANFGKCRIHPEYGTDICTYTRAFFVGAFWFAVCSFCAALFFGWIGHSLYAIVAYVLGYLQELPESTVIFMGVAGVLSLSMIVVLFYDRYQNYKYEKRARDRAQGKTPPPPGFITLTYRKFKDKTCFKINFNKE